MTKYGVAKDCVKNPGDEPMWCGCPEWGLSTRVSALHETALKH